MVCGSQTWSGRAPPAIAPQEPLFDAARVGIDGDPGPVRERHFPLHEPPQRTGEGARASGKRKFRSPRTSQSRRPPGRGPLPRNRKGQDESDENAQGGCSRRAAAMLLAPSAAEAARQQAPTAKVEVLSNRADLISAGDALVRLELPARRRRVEGHGARRHARRHQARSPSAPNGKFEGLVTGLDVGRTTLTARYAGTTIGTLVVTNHPNGGPVFSGPQVKPWVCQEGAVDAQCNQPPSYEYQYKTSDGSFAEYDPENPPDDVATTTTDQGKEVPYIVRIETGYQARDQYRIAALYDPAKPWKPWAPQDGYNGKVLITHGASCGIERQAGSAPDVMNDAALSRGYAVMSTALNNAGHNCNIVTQAESMVMAKERIVEQYGADPLHDRHGLLGRLAHPAAGRQRLPRHLPGHPAGVLASPTRGRPASSSPPTTSCASTSRTPPSGRPASCGSRSRSARSRAIPTTSTRSSSTRSTGPTWACRTTAAPACRTSRSTTPRRTPAASAARWPTT